MEDSVSYKKQTITGFIWMFLERFGAQGVGIVVSIVLARLLNPSDYGVVAIINVFIGILTMFISGGMSIALVQKKDADDLDFSSLFYLNIIICVILYVGLFVASPGIAKFYDMPELTSMMRVNAIMFLVSGFRAVQAAYCSRHLLFKRFFFATLGGTVGAAVLGIFMAYKGFGAWALIAQNLFNNVVDSVILWVTVKWRPKKMFSFDRIKKLFSYGWKLFVSSILELIYNNIYPLIIGKVYTKTDLAYYNKGQNLPNSFVTMINATLDKVLLPVMSNVQDETERLRNMTRRSIQLGTYVLMPLLIGFAVCADTVVKLLLTEKWMDVVPYIRVFCCVYLLLPIQTANLNAIKAIGRSDLYLKLDIIKKIVGIVVLLLTIKLGVLWMAIGQIVVAAIGQVINCGPNKKLLGYSLLQQLADILPSVLMTAVMAGVVYLIPMLGLSNILTLVLQVLVGAIIYIGLSVLFKVQIFTYIIGFVKPILSKKKGN